MSLHMDEHVHNHISLFLSSIFNIFFFFFLTNFPTPSLCQEDDRYAVCSKPFSCGKVSNIYYPFWGGEKRPNFCGFSQKFKLSCDAATRRNTTIQAGSQTFQVLSINQLAYTMTMVRITGLAYDNCSSASGLSNTSLGTSQFHFTPNVKNITIYYDCPESKLSKGNHSFACLDGGGSKRGFYVESGTSSVDDAQNCQGGRVEVQVTQQVGGEGGIQGLNEALWGGFDVNYSSISETQRCFGCFLTEGVCGTIYDSQFTCYCPDGSNALDCSRHHGIKWNWKRKLGVGVAAGVVSAGAVGIAFYIYYCQKKKRLEAASFIPSHSNTRYYDPSLEDSEKGCKYSGLQFFSYSELEEATNYFDSGRELGDGGFGTVFLGKLEDGRLVAVKRMYENNERRVEQFMNEVDILTGLRHPNLVSLYGCTSRQSRELLLVYEYIANGTVADHLHGRKAKEGTLSWDIRMNIALETASALVYLHARDIIHRDVKTNNILLDDHFRVKVADFGLSRLFPDHVTHISTAPQGTPGYVDPEYHEYYRLTDKSDVYSFGVVLVELVSSMHAVDITRHRHEINLSHMAIKKIQSGALHELVDPTLGFDSDFKVRKMVNAVAELAFQCLQSSKDMRPSMHQVLETLNDIHNDGKYDETKAEVMNISQGDDALVFKTQPPPPSPDSNLVIPAI